MLLTYQMQSMGNTRRFSLNRQILFRHQPLCMRTLLRIDSSPFAAGTSFSRELTGEFVQEWRQRHPDARVVTRDLSATILPPVNAEWIGAVYTPEPDLTARQR